MAVSAHERAAYDDSVEPRVYYDPEPRWNVPTLAAFRFCFIYFGLYVITTQMLGGLIPIPGVDIPELASIPPLRNLYLWVGAHVMGISHPIDTRVTGSGDKLFNWVQIFTMATIALICMGVWTMRDRRGARDVRIYKWFRLFLRFAVGTTLISYGFSKVIPLQMPTTFLSRLVEPYGNFSPMGVLWSSIGASPAYEVFVGLAEVVAGTLLFFPRTAALGAMIALADAIEIFTLNMTYDVPVKLLSFHLVLMSLFLLAPNMRRLLDLYILHRETRLVDEPVVLNSAAAQRRMVIGQSLFGVLAIVMTLYGSMKAWKQYGGGAPKSALYGIWDVDQMVVDNEVRPPLLTDSTRWKRIIFQYPTFATFQRMADNTRGYGTAIDTVARTMTLTTFDSAQTKSVMHYTRPDRDHLTIDGDMSGHTVHFDLRYRDPDSYLIRSRGFHWVSEVPYNR